MQRLRSAQNLGDVGDLVHLLHERLLAVEAVAHKPQPIVTRAEFEEHQHMYSGLSGYTGPPST